MQSRTNTPEPSAPEPSEPTSVPIDLSAIAERNPVNVQEMVLDLSTFDATALTLLEVLDMSEVAGVPPEELGTLLKRDGMSPAKARLLYALGWCIARRENATLKFSDVMRWKMTVKGKPDEEASSRNAKRAAAVVNAARVSGLPPKDAGNLTMAELGAYRGANRATRRRGRKR